MKTQKAYTLHCSFHAQHSTLYTCIQSVWDIEKKKQQQKNVEWNLQLMEKESISERDYLLAHFC